MAEGTAIGHLLRVSHVFFFFVVHSEAIQVVLICFVMIHVRRSRCCMSGLFCLRELLSSDRGSEKHC